MIWKVEKIKKKGNAICHFFQRSKEKCRCVERCYMTILLKVERKCKCVEKFVAAAHLWAEFISASRCDMQ